MAGVALGAAMRQIGRLFEEGGDGATADGPLLGRFLDRGDPLAFEALVARHGPMVLATCRAVLRDPADAEDAFQATFLALVRKAGAIRGRDALGGWLHRVAHRAAVQANLDAARRREQERKAGAGRPAIDPADPARDEARAAVHEELARLPDRFRLPVVLCHLEGKTHAQAAFELGWGEATVRRRLADARDRLRRRLTRRGVAPSASALAAIAGPSAAVPAAWVASTLPLAALGARGTAAALASATLRALALGRAATVAKSALALAAAAAGLAAGIARAGGDEPARMTPPPPRAAPVAPKPAPEPAPATEAEGFRGVVLGPDGKPFAGAKLAIWELKSDGIEPAADAPTRATSGPDGRFEFRVPAGEATRRDASRRMRWLVATAGGLGAGWAHLAPGVGPVDVGLKLAADEPVEGRILDLEGRPVAGAEVGVFWLAEPRNGVESFLAAVRAEPELHAWLPGDNNSWIGRLPGQPSFVRAGGDGRFRLAGLGRDRIAELVVRGATVAESKVTVLTRRMDPVVGPASTRPQPDPPAPLTVRGSAFDFAAPPSRPIAGVVRDRASGRPLAGVRVTSPKVAGKSLDRSDAPGAVTDAEGRYTLLGHPKASAYAVAATPPPGSDHLAGGVEVADTPGLVPIVADLRLAAGIPFRVRPVDSETGRAVEAKVEYYPLHPNPNVRELAGKSGLPSLARAARQADGSYAGVMLPGPGAICVEGAGGKYLRTRVDPWATFRPGAGPRPKDRNLYGDASTLIVEMGEGGIWFYGNDQFHDIVLVDPEPDSGPMEREARLLPAPKLAGSVLGPDGNPLAGAKVWNLDGAPAWSAPLLAARFEATRLDPLRPRKLVFRHDGLKLAGQLMPPAKGPTSEEVTLRPWATLSGRLVDRDGRPRPGLKLLPFGGKPDDPAEAAFTEWVQADAEGRFRLEGLVPGLNHRLAVMVDGGFSEGCTVFEGVILKPGEVRDLGDVRAESDRPGAAR